MHYVLSIMSVAYGYNPQYKLMTGTKLRMSTSDTPEVGGVADRALFATAMKGHDQLGICCNNQIRAERMATRSTTSVSDGWKLQVKELSRICRGFVVQSETI